MSKLVFNFNMNFQGTVLIRKKKTNQTTIDTLKDMESEITEWKKFHMLSLESSFQKKLYNQLERVQRRDTHAQSQPLKNKLSEGGFQELSEKAESDYYSVEIFYIGRKKKKPMTKGGTPQPCWQRHNKIKWKEEGQNWINLTLKISPIKTVREAKKASASPGFEELEQRWWFQEEKDSNMNFWPMFALFWIVSKCFNLIDCYFFFLQLKKRRERFTCYLNSRVSL